MLPVQFAGTTDKIFVTSFVFYTLIRMKAFTGKGKSNLEDEEIVALFFKRDESAIARVADKYGARLLAIATGITQNAETAEECVNDAYMQAWEHIPPNEPANYLYAFLARMVRHIAIDRCRQKDSLKRSAFIVELSDEMEECLPSAGGVEEALDAQILGETIQRFLLRQPEEKRVLFLRRYFYMESVTDISRRMQISESKVKTSLLRIRRELKGYLTKEGYTL